MHTAPPAPDLRAPRRPTVPVDVGGVVIGGGAPIVVQSMTNTDTADIEATARQTADLARAGSEIVRITVDRDEAAKAVPYIRDRLAQMGVAVPLVGDFHYNGHTLLSQNRACGEALDKWRINPGNVGFKAKRDTQFSTIVELALQYGKPVRIGVNWGSLDQDLLTRLMDENAAAAEPRDARSVMHEAIVQSALLSAGRAEALGLGAERIILSAKVSAVQDLVSVYTLLAERCRYALHLGLTEAGMGSKGIVASTAGIGLLLQQGIGDTIRVSLTPEPGGDRTLEVRVAQEILQTMGLRSFVPIVAACPGCGRTTSTVFQELASDIQGYVRSRMPEWRTLYPGVESLELAVMGCIVNGPGESKHADIGISLPGTGEAPSAPVFIDGQKAMTLRGPNIASSSRPSSRTTSPAATAAARNSAGGPTSHGFCAPGWHADRLPEMGVACCHECLAVAVPASAQRRHLCCVLADDCVLLVGQRHQLLQLVARARLWMADAGETRLAPDLACQSDPAGGVARDCHLAPVQDHWRQGACACDQRARSGRRCRSVSSPTRAASRSVFRSARPGTGCGSPAWSQRLRRPCCCRSGPARRKEEVDLEELRTSAGHPARPPSARLHRRQEGHDAARPRHRLEVQDDRRGLRHPALWPPGPVAAVVRTAWPARLRQAPPFENFRFGAQMTDLCCSMENS